MRDESGLGRALAVEREEQATEREAFRRGDRAWYVERGPTVPSPDVGAAAPILEEVEVEKGLAPVVEHPGRLLHDAGPSEDLREHGGEIVEQLWRAAAHGGFSLGSARAPSAAPVASGEWRDPPS